MGDINTINKDLNDLLVQGKALLQKGASDLMNSQREKATKLFSDLGGVPTRSHEAYKYTDLLPVFDHPYTVDLEYRNVMDDLNKLFYCDVPELDTNLVLLINGWYYNNNRSLDLPKGVIVCSLRYAAKNHKEIFDAHYGKYAKIEEDAIAALNTGLAQDGVFIYVPKNVVVEKPIQVINLLRSDRDLMATQRNLVIIEPNAQAKVLFCDHTLTKNKYLSNTVSEINVAENAVFDLYTLQNQHLNSTVINSVYLRQDTNSNVLSNTISLYGGVIRNNINVLLDGEHCENNTFGMYLLDRNQHVDNYTFVDHAKPNCISREHFKGVMDDESTASFTGKIHVRRDAQKTEAFQTNNNLLLSSNAQINTKPQLVIEADDVKCTHGATVGQMNEDSLFYIQTRGIDEKEAKMMLMFAFAHEIIQKIRIEPLKDRIDELVEKRLRGEISQCNTCSIACNQ